MARLFWLVVMLAFVLLLLTGASWIVAYYGVGTLLGAPPPQMGTQHTTLQWHGLSSVRANPPTWRFSFAPTEIPGAPSVRIYVSLTGQVIRTEPGNLPNLLKDFRRRGY